MPSIADFNFSDLLKDAFLKALLSVKIHRCTHVKLEYVLVHLLESVVFQNLLNKIGVPVSQLQECLKKPADEKADSSQQPQWDDQLCAMVTKLKQRKGDGIISLNDFIVTLAMFQEEYNATHSDTGITSSSGCVYEKLRGLGFSLPKIVAAMLELK